MIGPFVVLRCKAVFRTQRPLPSVATALLVFDLDGALIDTLADLHAAVSGALIASGLPATTLAQTRMFLGEGGRQLITRSIAAAGRASAIDVEAVYASYRRLYRHLLSTHSKAYDGWFPWLTNAEPRLARAVLTNKAGDAARLLMARLHCLDAFHFVIGEGDGFPSKPRADALHWLRATTRLPTSRCWMIGDNWTDLQAAEAAGFQSVFCEFGYGQSGLYRPAISARSPREAVAALARQLSP